VVSFFTFAYLVRLVAWGLAAALTQGGLVALSWLAWQRVMANATAALRHRIVCIHFAALLVLPVLTVVIVGWTVAGMGVPVLPGSPASQLPSLMASYRRAFWLCLSLVMLWFAGASLMLLRLAMDARRVVRLHRGSAPDARVEAVHRLARDRMGVKVHGVQVADVTTPQIIGAWRPILLIPRDLACNLSMAQWEAVLLHELAHVQRRDFGWNLLQRLQLSLLWFHPAAWALYRRVSREREGCCDALAVSHGASATGLAQALVCLAESRASPSLGMAISSQGELTTRVHRLLGVNRAAPLPAGLRVSAITASMLCLLALGTGRLGCIDPSMADVYHASAFGPMIVVDAHDDAGSFALGIKQGRVIEASVGSQRLPSDRIVQKDDRVFLMGAGRQPIVALTVTPQARIEWEGRR
jgi:beta-lactamase regulating signal transducer with metallopeptidase domain